jgi:hypothetical protein
MFSGIAKKHSGKDQRHHHHHHHKNHTHGAIDAEMQKALEPLLNKYHVDINLFGHVHFYNRLCAIYEGKCAHPSKGTIHILMGNAGAGSGDERNVTKQGPLSVYADRYFGYTSITANGTNLLFQYFHNEGNVLADSFTISK